MKITICGSLAFSKEMGEIAKKLEILGHTVFLPASTSKILEGNLNLEEINSEKGSRAASDRAIKNNAIVNHYNKIKSSDAILVINEEKNNIENYIGGSAFMEMGFAFILNKKIFMLNNIPELNYKDEIVAMQPIILNGNLNSIK
jgi:hypothetical protein